MADRSADLRGEWVTEARLLMLVDLARSTYQSWLRDGLLDLPASGVFEERDVLEVLLAAVLRELFPLAEVRSLWRSLLREGIVRDFLELALSIQGNEDRLDLVVEPATGRLSLASNPASLLAAVRDDHRALQVQVVPLATRIAVAREGFGRFSSPDPLPAVRRGRPRGGGASATATGLDS